MTHPLPDKASSQTFKTLKALKICCIALQPHELCAPCTKQTLLTSVCIKGCLKIDSVKQVPSATILKGSQLGSTNANSMEEKSTKYQLSLQTRWAHTYQGNPEYNILINKAVKILVQKQQSRAYESCIVQVHFTFGHVCNLQLKTKEVETLTYWQWFTQSQKSCS